MEFIITIQEPEIQLITVASQGEQGIAGLIWIDAGWASGVDYIVDNALEHNGSSYRVFVAHTSSAANEPGVGVDWETVWKVVAEKGDSGVGGDMTKAVYDPTAVENDAFDMDNMAAGTNNKILTAVEKAGPTQAEAEAGTSTVLKLWSASLVWIANKAAWLSITAQGFTRIDLGTFTTGQTITLDVSLASSFKAKLPDGGTITIELTNLPTNLEAWPALNLISQANLPAITWTDIDATGVTLVEDTGHVLGFLPISLTSADEIIANLLVSKADA